MPCTNIFRQKFWGYNNAAPEDSSFGERAPHVLVHVYLYFRGSGCIHPEGNQEETRERRKLNTTPKCWYLCTYLQCQHQKTATFKNNLLFYNTPLYNNAVYLYVCGLFWAYQHSSVPATPKNVKDWGLLWLLIKEQLPDRAIAMQHNSYQVAIAQQHNSHQTELQLSSTTATR